MNNTTNILKGAKYRITVLSEILLRLEYSETGEFLDETTEFARNRNFTIPKFNIQQDERFLVIVKIHASGLPCFLYLSAF